jgi:hypothetical protein
MTESATALPDADSFVSLGAIVAVAPPELFRVNSPIFVASLFAVEFRSGVSNLKSQI